MKKSGIYDLKKYPYIAQTRINICVKNTPGNNPLFDATPNFRLEDQEYCSKVLKEKQKIGFCDKGEYCYNRSNEGSIVSNVFHAYYIFESSTEYFERLAAQFDDDIPVYYQNMILNDMVWKLKEDKLFPYHYSDNDFRIAVDRLKVLLLRIDVTTIINHPNLDNFEKQYWLKLKPNTTPIVLAEKETICICVDSQKIYSRNNMEIIIHKLRVNNKQLHLRAFVKSPIYTYFKEPANVYAIENEDTDNRKKLPVSLSIHSFYHSKEQTCNFYAFSYHCNTEEVKSLNFVVEFDGIIYDTVFWCMPTAVFNKNADIDSYVRDNVKITLKNNKFFLNNLQKRKLINLKKIKL